MQPTTANYSPHRPQIGGGRHGVALRRSESDGVPYKGEEGVMTRARGS